VETAGELRGADGPAAARGGARDLHPAGERGRDGECAQSVLPRGEKASGAVPAAGSGHRAWVADGLPERASAQALALQVTERVTDI
jgi:hypothetical protein